MRKLFLVVLATTCLVGCSHRRLANDRSATFGVPMVTTEEEDAARDAFVACMRVAEPALDDGISDASTIAAAVRVSCPGQWNAWTNLMHRGRPPSAFEAIERGAEEGRKQLALVVVLETREKRRAAKP